MVLLVFLVVFLGFLRFGFHHGFKSEFGVGFSGFYMFYGESSVCPELPHTRPLTISRTHPNRNPGGRS